MECCWCGVLSKYLPSGLCSRCSTIFLSLITYSRSHLFSLSHANLHYFKNICCCGYYEIFISKNLQYLLMISIITALAWHGMVWSVINSNRLIYLPVLVSVNEYWYLPRRTEGQAGAIPIFNNVVRSLQQLDSNCFSPQFSLEILPFLC